MGQNLGSGHFGLVVKGFLKTEQGTQVVAVKMLRGGCAEHFLCSFNVSRFLDVSIGKDQIHPPHPPTNFSDVEKWRATLLIIDFGVVEGGGLLSHFILFDCCCNALWSFLSSSPYLNP